MRKVEQYYSLLPFVHHIQTCTDIDIDMHKIVAVAGLGARNGKQIYDTLFICTLLYYCTIGNRVAFLKNGQGQGIGMERQVKQVRSEGLSRLCIGPEWGY